jgi:hypothetical protein
MVTEVTLKSLHEGTFGHFVRRRIERGVSVRRMEQLTVAEKKRISLRNATNSSMTDSVQGPINDLRLRLYFESPTTRGADGLDFSAIGGKIQRAR